MAYCIFQLENLLNPTTEPDDNNDWSDFKEGAYFDNDKPNDPNEFEPDTSDDDFQPI